MKPSNYNLHVMFICLIVAIIPILAGFDFSYLNTRDNNDAVTSTNVAFAAYAMIFSTLPSILDSILDILSSNKIRTQFSEYWYTRTYITIASLICGLLYFAASNNPPWLRTSNLPAAMLITRYFFHIIASCSLMNGLCVCKPDLFTPKQTALISLFYSISYICRLYGQGTQGIFDAFSSVLVSLSCTCWGVNCIYWTHKMRSWNFKSVEENASVLYLGMVYFLLFAVLTGLIYSWSTTASTGSFSSILLFLYFLVLGNLILAVIPGRILRYETIVAKIEVAETRTDCTKYIVEKMRGPWHTVSIGLIILYEQIPRLYLNSMPLIAAATASTSDCEGSEDNSPVSAVETAFNIICGASNSVGNAMRNFNFYASFLSGELVVSKQSDVNLRILIDEVIQKFDVDLVQKNISITKLVATTEGGWLSLYTGDILIEADDDLVDLMIFHLLSNAIKFTPAGGHIKLIAYINKMHESIPVVDNRINIVRNENHRNHLSRRISFLPPFAGQNLQLPSRNEVVVIQIIDSGIGFSDDDKPNLFKEVQLKSFNSSNASNPLQVEGLGLWVSKRIVELHGGKIEACSEGLGRGTTFSAELPIWTTGMNSEASLQVNTDSFPDEKPISSLHDEYENDPDFLVQNNNCIHPKQRPVILSPVRRIEKRLDEQEQKYDESYASQAVKISLRDISESNSNSKSISLQGSSPWQPSRFHLWSRGRTRSTNTSTWQPNGISVAIEGPRSAFKQLVTKSLSLRFKATILSVPAPEFDFMISGNLNSTVVDYSIPQYRESNSNLASTLQLSVASLCSTGINVLIEDYYGRFLTSISKDEVTSLTAMRRPTYTFFLSMDETMSTQTIIGCSSGDLTSIYRELGCYEVSLDPDDSVEDVVETISHIMHFFVSVQSDISQPSLSVSTE